MKRLSFFAPLLVACVAFAIAPSAGLGLSKKTGGLTPRSLKCMKRLTVWDKKVFAKCKPQFTLTAVHELALAAVDKFDPETLFQSYVTTGEDPYGTDTESHQISFDSIFFPCLRDFPRPGESGCSLIVRDVRYREITYTPDPGQNKYESGCVIWSPEVLGVNWEIAGNAELFHDPETVALKFKKPKPFSVSVNVEGPNPNPPPALPC